MKEKIFEYIRNQYGADPEYLWENVPDFAIFRRADNKKWFAHVASVAREKIGLEDAGYVDIISLKINDPILQDDLIHENGIIPSYYLSKKYWITVLLDGNVPEDKVTNLIDISYLATGSKKRKTKD